MKIVVAESKSMGSGVETLPMREVREHRPAFAAEADMLMESIRNLTVAELSDCLGISARHAAKVSEYVYDFPMKQTGYQAVDAFSGVVFKAARLHLLPSEAYARALERVEIVSSLYGLLRLDDIIKPYRFDYTTRLPGTDFQPLYSYWRPKLTVALSRQMKEEEHPLIVNLLPGDALKCVDKKLLKSYCEFLTVDFKSLDPNGKLTTPRSTRLKELRGLFLRHILEQDIRTSEQLRQIATREFTYVDDAPYPGILRFLCD